MATGRLMCMRRRGQTEGSVSRIAMVAQRTEQSRPLVPCRRVRGLRGPVTLTESPCRTLRDPEAGISRRISTALLRAEANTSSRRDRPFTVAPAWGRRRRGPIPHAGRCRTSTAFTGMWSLSSLAIGLAGFRGRQGHRSRLPACLEPSVPTQRRSRRAGRSRAPAQELGISGKALHRDGGGRARWRSLY